MDEKQEFALNLTLEVGNRIKEKLHTCFTIDEKSGRDDLVTDIDRWCEKYYVKKISEKYPSDSILGEEGNGNAKHGREGNVWIIDPIDGTTNFVKMRENFCTMLSYFESGKGKFAVILDPLNGRYIYGGPGIGVYQNGQKLDIVDNTCLKNSLVDISRKLVLSEDIRYKEIVRQAIALRILGCTGQIIQYILLGKLSLYISNLSPWDYAPALVLGNELGIKITTETGREPILDGMELIVMGTPSSHLSALKLLKKGDG